MQTHELERLYSLNPPDNKILENSRIRGWLEELEREFTVEHKAIKTRETYRRVIIHFILWKFRTRCQDVAEVAIRNYLTYLAEVRKIAAINVQSRLSRGSRLIIV